ncbi:PREDICTED: transcription factor ORG3-like isoform X2 [Tarenaya hassleriana]|uniref:transcription factor ORG3-like isoform X2 n=1 Tax=Tarenaya hassleriana TaxID=28532 RepID=UPI00053C594E|nr:PREDICTED: transcription factor ORG3-like isoform X2 [Tarenaya hassleriana]
MCALVPPLFPNFGWPSTSEVQIYGSGDINDGGFLDFPEADAPESLRILSNSSAGKGKSDKTAAKKLGHNASERDRRKKINALFSSLRSLLPSSDHSKLSLPATVSHALNYIGELQEQIKKLIQKKEELLLGLSRQTDIITSHKGRDDDDDDDHGHDHDTPVKAMNVGFASIVSATRLGETELMVQISSPKTVKCSFSNVLTGLEEDGFVLIDASSSLSRGDRLFYTLHFQAEVGDNYKLNVQDLSDKLLSLYEFR